MFASKKHPIREASWSTHHFPPFMDHFASIMDLFWGDILTWLTKNVFASLDFASIY